MHLALMGASRLFNPLQHIARGFLPRQALQASRPAAPPLRVTRIMDEQRPQASAGRMVISGRMADVCAELDRLVELESRR